MILSRISIQNFRNFRDFDVELEGNVVVVGENRVGKSNLLYGLRLVFDSTLPDSARQLSRSDFWDGIDEPGAEDKIVVSVEITDFEDDCDILAQLTDYRIDDDPETVRLTYEFRPKSDLDGEPETDDDYEFLCFGGEDDQKGFGHELRRRITMDLLPALRDAESDLSNWRRSPLKPLIESTFSTIDRDDLVDIKEAIESATENLKNFDSVEELEKEIHTLFASMSGPKQDVNPMLGIGETDVTRLNRNIRLLIDEGKRSIGDASLGSANIVFLTLKLLELNRLMEENKRDHTLLAIEEPEAHLHPHLQRSVYRHLFKDIASREVNSSSIILTTHSPHIASIAPLNSILLLRDSGENGTVGYSTVAIDLKEEEREDITRYLDVTRAEMLFARGIILVEGDAEKFLLPVFAEFNGHSLDQLGITICSVSGTNFNPYAKFLTALGIPFSVVTDWDPIEGKYPLGYNRSLKLIKSIEQIKTGENPVELINELKNTEDGKEYSSRIEEYGIFTNFNTLELDMFNGKFAEEIIKTLREGKISKARKELLNKWEEDKDNFEPEIFLKLINHIGKGRFAQRLASRVANIAPPDYIEGAINYVVNRV